MSERSPLARNAAWTVVFVAIGAVSLFASNFWLQLGLFAMAAAIAAIGLSMLVGVAGQLSLAHAFFMAVGAYGYAWLAGTPDEASGLRGAGLPPIIAAIAAVLMAGVAGAIFSPIAGRLRGIYLGLASIGLVFIGQHIMDNAASLTGGFNGRDAAPMRLFGFAFADNDPNGLRIMGQEFDRFQRLWVLFLVVLLAAAWFARNIVNGRTGRAWATMRDSETAAGVLGINVPVAKATAFTVSSMYAGLGGVLTALAFGRIVPESFALSLSIDLLVMIVIGGIGTVNGAALGAVFVTALPLVLDRYSGALPLLAEPGQPGLSGAVAARLLYGLAIILVLLFSPSGLASLWGRVRPDTPHDPVTTTTTATTAAPTAEAAASTPTP